MFPLFSLQPIFHQKRKTELRGIPPPPVASHMFCIPSLTVKQFWKYWKIWEIHNTFCFPLYLEKVKNGATFLKSKTMMFGHDASEFWHPSRFFITYYRQRDLTVEVFRWQWQLDDNDNDNFCKYLPWPTSSTSSVTRIRWLAAIILVKAW